MNQKKRWPLIVILAVLLLAAGFYAYRYFSVERSAVGLDSYERYTVREDALSVTVTGSGKLETAEETKCRVPVTVKISKVNVETGDIVYAGDPLVMLDRADIEKRMLTASQTVSGYDRQIAAISEVTSIYCLAKGRIKALYASNGDYVADVMKENGALAVISTDGLMQITLAEAAGHAAGEKVLVRWDGGEAEGTVAGSGADGAAVTLSDEKAPLGAEAEVVFDNGSLETGILTVHAPAAVYGTDGVIKDTYYKENDKVYPYNKLFVLETEVLSDSYRELLKEREEAMDELRTLMSYKDNPVILSDTEGLVASVEVSEGEVVEKDRVLSVLYTGGAVKMVLEIDELDIPDIMLGQTAAVTMDAYPEEPFVGTVTRISRLGKASGSITVYDVTLTLLSDDRLLTGMNGSAVITTETKDGVLTVPVSSLQEDDDGTTFVYVEAADGQIEKQTVTTGISDGTNAEITGGLSAGDTVLYTEKTADILTLMYQTRANVMGSRRNGRRE